MLILNWILHRKLSLCLDFSNSKIGMVIPALSMHPVLISTCKIEFYAVFNFVKVLMTEEYKTGEVLTYVNSCSTWKQNWHQGPVRILYKIHTQRMPGQCSDSCRKLKSQASPLVPSGKMEVLRGCHRNKTLKKWIPFFTRTTFSTLDEEQAGTHIQNGSELLFRF